LSTVRRLTWLPGSICEEIATQVVGLLSHWAAEWNLPVPAPVRCEPVAADAAFAHDLVDLLGEPLPAWKQVLAHALFKFDAHGSRLVNAVVERMIASLQQRLLHAFGADQSIAEADGPLGEQGIQVVAEVLGQRCGFALTNAQLRASGKLKFPASQALPGVSFESALADTPVRLIAELGKADVSVDELMHLAPGDVLLLRESLDSPLRVLAPGSALELSAHLGAITNPPQRALRWLAS